MVRFATSTDLHISYMLWRCGLSVDRRGSPGKIVISSVLRTEVCPIFVRGPPRSPHLQEHVLGDHCGEVRGQKSGMTHSRPRMNVISSVLRMGHARFLSADLPTVIPKNMYEMRRKIRYDRRLGAQDERHILRPTDGSCPIFVRGPPHMFSKITVGRSVDIRMTVALSTEDDVILGCSGPKDGSCPTFLEIRGPPRRKIGP